MVWETCSLSAKGRAGNHVKQKYTHSFSAVTEGMKLLQQPWLRVAFAYPWSKRKRKKVTGSWRRAGWSGSSQERHSQKWVRLSSLGTCRFAPGSVCPGTQPTLLPTCDVPMQAAASMWGLWDLALSCPGKVRFWGSVLQQGGILHRTAVIYGHICEPLNPEMDV